MKTAYFTGNNFIQIRMQTCFCNVKGKPGFKIWSINTTQSPPWWNHFEIPLRTEIRMMRDHGNPVTGLGNILYLLIVFPQVLQVTTDGGCCQSAQQDTLELQIREDRVEYEVWMIGTSTGPTWSQITSSPGTWLFVKSTLSSVTAARNSEHAQKTLHKTGLWVEAFQTNRPWTKGAVKFHKTI